MFQEGTCISQELYNVANGVELPAAGILDALGNAVYASIWGSTWIAEAGVHYDMNSPLGTGYIWSARSGDGDGTNPDGVPMDTVFRLRADVDITKYAPSTQVVLRALQEHGAVVYDSAGSGLDGAGLLAMSNGWTGTDYLTAQRELNGLPMNLFEAVDVWGLAVDPTTSWQTR